MAEFLGVDPSTVRRWLSGATTIPGPAIVALNLYVEKQTWKTNTAKSPATETSRKPKSTS